MLARRLDGVQIDAAPADDRDVAREQLGRRRRAVVALQHEVALPPGAGRVAVAVPVPDQVQPCGRAELEHVERAPVRHGEKPRQQRPGPLDLVRLHALLGREAPELGGVLDERAADVDPPRLTGEHEVMERAEQAKRKVPVEVGGDLGNKRVVREAAAEIRVELRAAVAVAGLPAEDLRLPVYFAVASAAFACSTNSANFAGSTTARSARTLRSSSISAAFRPEMNWL